jgi:hypothetical protein
MSKPARFNYFPVPNGAHSHAESAARTEPDPPTGFQLIGARVRGRKHKHEGTHCDDWFEFARSGVWSVIAVADGAGSKRWSRAGAKIACQTAIASLSADLRDVFPVDRPTAAEWNAAAATNTDGERSGEYCAPDLRAVQQALSNAVRRAAAAVQAAAAEIGDPEPRRAADLDCTLLLALHTPVVFGDETRDLIFTFSIGDSLAAGVLRNGEALAFSEPDTGEYAGETLFLSLAAEFSDAQLAARTTLGLCQLQALLVMSDGVASDYEPVDQIARLWADLVLNRIPAVRWNADSTSIGLADGESSPDFAAPAELDEICELVEPDPRSERTLRSSAEVARICGVSIAQLLKSPAAAAWLEPPRLPVRGESPAERLRDWLEAYYVRGSFDDRTLVILHREDLP